MKILIIRFSSIGDIVLTSPIVRCVKKQLNAEVDFLTKKAFLPVVHNNPYITNHFYLENNLDAVIEGLKKQNYDCIIDLHKNLRSKKVVKALGVPSYSFDKLNIEKWLWVNFKLNRMPDKHLVDRYFEGIESLKVNNDGEGLDYFIGDDDELDLAKYNLRENEFVAIAIGGNHNTKKLPTIKLLEIIKRLNAACVLLGGKEDLEAALEVMAQVDDKKVVNLVGELSINNSAFVVEKAAKVITHDTGMMHIAAAFKKKTLSIWGNTHPKLGLYPYLFEGGKELTSQYSIYQVALNCRPCSKIGHDQCPRGHFNCMNLQNVEQIVQNCNSNE